ncbi:hypothetical protein D065_07355 [Streptococcus mitis 13/39]|jgi:hypothetical protein|uniref:Uncharacterized protein n=1 Tax=Streptococcus mitis 13/39 TaxID=1239793 RepID=R0MAH3_STRMT|nr:hypothetical protein D065_07355 [Streptococcus mitis 13/39]
MFQSLELNLMRIYLNQNCQNLRKIQELGKKVLENLAKLESHKTFLPLSYRFLEFPHQAGVAFLPDMLMK